MLPSKKLVGLIAVWSYVEVLEIGVARVSMLCLIAGVTSWYSCNTGSLLPLKKLVQTWFGCSSVLYQVLESCVRVLEIGVARVSMLCVVARGTVVLSLQL